MKEVVKGRTTDSMDTLVQQTESPFTAEVLHFPLPAKFRMPQVEAFDGARDPVDHLNTYKNQMELHGYQDPVRCRVFAITLKGLALAWFNRLPPLINLLIQRVIHCVRLPLHLSQNIQKAKLSFADHQAELAREPEVLCLEVQCRVSEGRYTRQKVCDHRIHRWARSAVKRFDVFHLKKPSSKHG